MRKSIVQVCSCVAVLAVAVLVGCSGGGVGKTNSPATQSRQVASSAQATATSAVKTIDDVVSAQQKGLFVEDADGAVEPIVSTYTSGDDIIWLQNDYDGYTKYDAQQSRKAKIEEYFGTPTGGMYRVSTDGYVNFSKSSGKRLLMVSSESKGRTVQDAALVDSGYCQPENVSGDLRKYDSVGNVDTSAYNSSADTQAEIQAMLDVFILTDGGKNVICSETSRTLDAGWYEGTSYKQGVLSLTQPYVVANGDKYEVGVEMTKDGYAILDVSELPAGLHGLLVDSKYYIINVED